MNNGKEFKLTERTVKEFNNFKEKAKLGKMLRTALVATPFLSILSSPPTSATVQIATSDWDTWGKTLQSMSGFNTSVLKRFCDEEILYHKLKNNRDDELFWVKLKASLK